MLLLLLVGGGIQAPVTPFVYTGIPDMAAAFSMRTAAAYCLRMDAARQMRIEAN